jgi:hypothetical protein
MFAMHDPQNDLTIAEEVLEDIAPKRISFTAVEWNNTSYASLVLREPTVADLLEARKKDDAFDQAIVLIQRVSKTPTQVLLLLPQRVLLRAADYFAPFTPPSPESVGES